MSTIPSNFLLNPTALASPDALFQTISTALNTSTVERGTLVNELSLLATLLGEENSSAGKQLLGLLENLGSTDPASSQQEIFDTIKNISPDSLERAAKEFVSRYSPKPGADLGQQRFQKTKDAVAQAREVISSPANTTLAAPLIPKNIEKTFQAAPTPQPLPPTNASHIDPKPVVVPAQDQEGNKYQISYRPTQSFPLPDISGMLAERVYALTATQESPGMIRLFLSLSESTPNEQGRLKTVSILSEDAKKLEIPFDQLKKGEIYAAQNPQAYLLHVKKNLKAIPIKLPVTKGAPLLKPETTKTHPTVLEPKSQEKQDDLGEKSDFTEDFFIEKNEAPSSGFFGNLWLKARGLFSSTPAKHTSQNSQKKTPESLNWYPTNDNFAWDPERSSFVFEMPEKTEDPIEIGLKDYKSRTLPQSPSTDQDPMPPEMGGPIEIGPQDYKFRTLPQGPPTKIRISRLDEYFVLDLLKGSAKVYPFDSKDPNIVMDGGTFLHLGDRIVLGNGVEFYFDEAESEEEEE